jgi:hypothetical protein
MTFGHNTIHLEKNHSNDRKESLRVEGEFDEFLGSGYRLCVIEDPSRPNDWQAPRDKIGPAIALN